MKKIIIGVGGGGCNAVDKIDIPNSKKLFVNSGIYSLNDIESEGHKIRLECGYRDVCPSYQCGCMEDPAFCKVMAEKHKKEIRESIIDALK